MEERFWEKVQKTEGCWLWTGAINTNGYPALTEPGHRGRQVRAHRYAYELLVGPIPEGMQIDHLCEVKRCVNPQHLEPVTAEVNSMRYRGKKTHCKHGHPLDGWRRLCVHGEYKVRRYCTTCRAQEWQRKKEVRRAMAA